MSQFPNLSLREFEALDMLARANSGTNHITGIPAPGDVSKLMKLGLVEQTENGARVSAEGQALLNEWRERLAKLLPATTIH